MKPSNNPKLKKKIQVIQFIHPSKIQSTYLIQSFDPPLEATKVKLILIQANQSIRQEYHP